MSAPYIYPFNQIHPEDKDILGDLAVNLSEAKRSSFPITKGFCISPQAYLDTLNQAGLFQTIESKLTDINPLDNKALIKKSSQVRRLIKSASIPQEITKTIAKLYASQLNNQHLILQAQLIDPYSQNFLLPISAPKYTKGDANLINLVRQIWANTFTSQQILFNLRHGLSHLQLSPSITVQIMPQPLCSGTLLTQDHTQQQNNLINIDATWGLYTSDLTPDHYQIEKQTLKIHYSQINVQQTQFTLASHQHKASKVPKKIHAQPKLNSTQLKQLTQLALSLSKHFLYPQKINWLYHQNKFYFTSITNLHSHAITSKETTVTSNQHLLYSATPTSPGIASGKIFILKQYEDVHKLPPNRIIVAKNLSSQLLSAIKAAKGVITETGSPVSLAAITSRELSIPCVVNYPKATKLLKDNQTITLNGTTGDIFDGNIHQFNPTSKPKTAQYPTKTATSILLNLKDFSRPLYHSRLNSQGVGRVSFDSIIFDLNHHPKHLISKNRLQLLNTFTDNLTKLSQSFGYRPIHLSLLDLTSHQYQQLTHSHLYEQIEFNHLLGFRGLQRILKDHQLLDIQLQSILQARKNGAKNIHLNIPFIRSVKELSQIKKHITSTGLIRSDNFHIWANLEVPSNADMIEKISLVGISGININLDSLAMFILGIDPHQEENYSQIDTHNPTFTNLLTSIISRAQQTKLPTNVYGHLLGIKTHLVEICVEQGVNNITVSPEQLVQTKELVSFTEHRLIKKTKSK